MVQYQKRNKSIAALRENRTGIPTQLKKRVEDNTALGLDDVRVHYNSGKPAELDALAFTQGNQVYLGPGQERHLPHELGHVVQQKLGMVRPDTRHESGAMLNTDPALERQADRIGAGGGHIAMSSAQRRSEPIVQRMSVLENRGDGVNLQIARYKRSGWLAVQQLGNFLTEDCMKEISVGQLEELSRAIQIMKPEEMYEKMEFVTGGMGIVQYRPEFQQEFAEKLAAAKAGAGPLEAWNIIAGKLQAVLEQCSASVGDMEEEMRAPLKMAELGKKGRYQRLERGAEQEPESVDPYFNYKKAALHCIAKKASTVRVLGGKPVGPHIALSVIGKNIYAAINSHVEGRALCPDDTLAARIREAISSISLNEVNRFLTVDSDFELGRDKGKLPNIQEVHQYIKELSGYPISIVDACKYREIKPGKLGPIHGEMAIMDYLQNRDEGQQIIEERGHKLDEIDPSQGGERRRVIWIGGTKVDCVMCHDHFRKINGYESQRIAPAISLGHDLGRNYVVSSREVGNGGTAYPGTKAGTHLFAKQYKMKGSSSNKRQTVEDAATEIVAALPAGAAPV